VPSLHEAAKAAAAGANGTIANAGATGGSAGTGATSGGTTPGANTSVLAARAAAAAAFCRYQVLKGAMCRGKEVSGQG